jgi:hypothetical protein
MEKIYIATIIVMVLFTIYWVYIMLTSKPKFNHGKSKFIRNWNEGGKILLISYMLISFGVFIALVLLRILIKLAA